MKTILLIDGENFKGIIKYIFKKARMSKPPWHEYGFLKLLSTVINDIKSVEKVIYFAKIKVHRDSVEKSKQLIEEQRKLKTHLEKQGFKVVLSGRVRGQAGESPNGEKAVVFTKKGVDVKIAVDMVSLACDRKVDQIVLCSSDSDLQPAVNEVRTRNVRCIYLGFEAQPNKGLIYTTNKTILIKDTCVLDF